MTERDRERFSDLMVGLGETYGEPVSAARMEIYFAALMDLPLAELRAAATIHVQTQKFFPRPSELREALHGTPEDRAELAWLAVLRLVRRFGYWRAPGEMDWPDEATYRAAMELYGGWRALCEKLPGGGPELLGCAKLFKASHAASLRHAVRASLPSREDATAKLRDVKAELLARGLPTGPL